MNELFDKLILRMVFALFLCLTLVLYRFVHHLIYPSNKGHIFSKFYPSKNSAESLHFFSRLLGIGIVFSEFHFDLDQGFLFAVIDFLIRAVVGFLVYLVSLYTVESIVLYNFDYHDEIVKRRNMPYALIGIAHALGFLLFSRSFSPSQEVHLLFSSSFGSLLSCSLVLQPRLSLS